MIRALLPIARLVARLPWPLLIALGALLGRLAPVLAPGRRRVVAENLALAFPELGPRARRRLLRANLRATGIALAENLAAWFRPRLPAGLARIEGLELLAPGPPLILLGAHFLPLELAARLIAEASGIRPHLLARPYRNPALEAALSRARARYTSSVIAKHETRRLIAALREGPALFYAPDQRAGKGSPELPFFGRPAPVHTAATRLAALAGARIVLFSFHRRRDRRYAIRLEPVPTDWPSEPRAFAARYLAWLEAKIREHPEQYLWAHRRFRPAAGRGPYSPAALRPRHR